MKKLSFIVVFAIFSLLANSLYAQRIYLKAGDLTQRGSVVKGFEDYIEISGVQYGVDAETSFYEGQGAAVGKPRFSELVITKNVDILSNELFRNIAAGKQIPLMEIVSTANTQNGVSVAHKIELKNVFVTSISNANSGDCSGCGGGAESVKFVYKAIRITTYAQNSKTGAWTANPNPFVLDVSTLTNTF